MLVHTHLLQSAPTPQQRWPMPLKSTLAVLVFHTGTIAEFSFSFKKALNKSLTSKENDRLHLFIGFL